MACQVWDPLLSEEQNFCMLFSDVADFVMNNFRKTASDVAAASISLREQFRSRPWLRDVNFDGINFNDITICCAYLKSYAACHCALATFAAMLFLNKTPTYILMDFFNRENIKIVSIGGGPGSDIVGFCSALSTRNRLCGSLTLTNVDIKNGWAEIFDLVFKYLHSGTYGAASLVSNYVTFLPYFVKGEMSGSLSALEVSSSDLILMTKVLSFVPPSKRQEKIQRIIEAMRPGAILLYTDIDSNLVLEAAGKFHTWILMMHSRDEFIMSVKTPAQMIRKSTYEICAIQKLSDYNPWLENDYWGLGRFYHL